jgi:hypothetical protein
MGENSCNHMSNKSLSSKIDKEKQQQMGKQIN